MSKFRLDSYQSAVLGNKHHLHAVRLNSVSAPMLYASGGLFARIVDKPVDDALSGDLPIANDSGCLKMEYDRLNVAAKMADAVRWARLTGGAVVLPITDDSPNLSDELDTSRITQIRELLVFDATQISASSYDGQYQPVHYIINHRNGSFTVHDSRLIFVRGEPLPSHLQVYQWQGRNAVDRAYQSLLDSLSAIQHIGNILERKQQAVYKMTGLYDAINNGMERQISQRVDLVDMVRGILNTIVIDNGDATGSSGDDYAIHDLNVSGLSEVINVFKEQVAADCGLPITLLFGRSAAGMNATGEGDLRGYYDLVDSIRQRQVKPALEKLIAMIAAQRALPETPNDDWRIEFEPLYKPTAREQAEINKLNAEALQVSSNALVNVINTGAISEQEAREWLVQESLFGLTPAATIGHANNYAEEVANGD